MKSFLLLFFLVCMLCLPNVTIAAAKQGLLLWVRQVVPVLLPFSILSHILLSSELIPWLCEIIARLFGWCYPIAPIGFYPLVAGSLFGFPVGAQIISELSRTKRLCPAQADLLLGMCCNLSPGFLLGLVLSQPYFIGIDGWRLLLCIELPPLILGRIFLIFLSKDPSCLSTQNKNTASRSQTTFKIIDAGIMNGFESLTRIGGYIMLFSILASFLSLLLAPLPFLRSVLIGLLEITNGIQLLQALPASDFVKRLICVLFLSSGGISGLFQVQAFTIDSDLSVMHYARFKLCTLILAFCSALLLLC